MSIEPRAAALAAAATIWLAACTSIAERYDSAAHERGLERREVTGGIFRLAVFTPRLPIPGGELHVYLEGDGTPLIGKSAPSADPTPRRPLMPALMAHDPGAKLLLGRPCYHGLAALPPCRPAHWTEARFGEAVVEGMSEAIRRLAEAGGHDGVALIGHSGGGVLALLMAQRLAQVRAVVALATVADIELWTRHHGLAPLGGSLNPNAAIRRDGVPELFLVGSADRVTPPELVRRAAERRANSRLRVFDGYDHACCWAEAWPEVLAWLAGQK